MTEFGEMCWGARQRAVTVTGRRECGSIRIYGPDPGARASCLGALQGEGQLWNAPGREARTHRPALYRTTMVALPDFLSRISLAISLDHSHTRLWPHKSWAMTVVAVVADDQGGQWVSRPP